MASPATVVDKGPEPVNKYSNNVPGEIISLAKLNVTGLFIIKGPKIVVTWSCKFEPTPGKSTIDSIYESK